VVGAPPPRRLPWPPPVSAPGIGDGRGGRGGHADRGAAAGASTVAVATRWVCPRALARPYPALFFSRQRRPAGRRQLLSPAVSPCRWSCPGWVHPLRLCPPAARGGRRTLCLVRDSAAHTLSTAPTPAAFLARSSCCSRSPQVSALQQSQKCSRSASAGSQRPIWNSFATVAVRKSWENGCNL